MTEKIKTTAPVLSVGADREQPNTKNHKEIIANETAQINLQAANIPEKSGSGGLQTVSMTELYDTVYPPRTPVVDGFLYGGTYLFVGAPKVGKSFFMGQGLEQKLDSLVRHELYAKYKTAPTQEERENARQEYLEKRGVPDSFRW